MRRIFRKWSRFVLPAILLGTASFAVGLSALLSRYPWTSITTEFGGVRPVRFFSPWPLNPLQQEMHDKKKKRLPKAEMQRIFSLDMRRMEYINVPVFDLFMSDKAKHTGGDSLFRSLGFGEFPWPWMETNRVFGDGAGPQKISYIPIPTQYGVSLQEGVLLAPGEEIEFPFPVSKLRRSFRFFVLPLNTGTLRINLGQYAWARTFVESDVNHLQFFAVPVNDVAAMVAKVSATSARLFLIQARIAQSEMSGRIPVQVAQESPFWMLNSKYLKAPEKEVEPQVSEEVADEPTEVAGKPEDADAPSLPVSAPVVATTPLFTPAPAAVPSSSDPQKDVVLDSLAITANPQVSVPGTGTVALGYNMMVVHLGNLPPALIANEARFAKIAPNISELVSGALKIDLESEVDAARAFRTLVLGDSLPKFQADAQILLRDSLERMDGVNLYRHLRDFGYQVLSIAPAQLLGFSKSLAWPGDGTLFSERTLDSNDWDFARKRVKIDRDAQPVTGLEAVFQTKEQVLPPALVTSDYASVEKYFEKISGDLETFPDWRANEYFLPDDRDYYSAATINQFQNWTNLNRQVRLFGHVWLGGGAKNERPALKDFVRGLSASGASGIPSELWNGKLTEAALMDRAFGQLRDVVKVRRLAHRTLWVVLVPQEKGLTAFVEIPGVLRKSFGVARNVSMNDFRATILSFIGIPMDSQASLAGGKIPGKSIEMPPQSVVASSDVVPTASEVGFDRLDRFVLRIAPGKTRCAPFVWRTRKPIVHISASHPVFELDRSRREFTVYPCSVASSWVSIDWFQHMEQVRALPGETRKESLLRRIGGEFVFAPGYDSERPVFYFGESMRRLGHPLFSLTSVPDSLVESLFARPWSATGGELVSTMQRLDAARRSLFPVDAREGTQILFARENSVQ